MQNGRGEGSVHSLAAKTPSPTDPLRHLHTLHWDIRSAFKSSPFHLWFFFFHFSCGHVQFSLDAASAQPMFHAFVSPKKFPRGKLDEGCGMGTGVDGIEIENRLKMESRLLTLSYITIGR